MTFILLVLFLFAGPFAQLFVHGFSREDMWQCSAAAVVILLPKFFQCVYMVTQGKEARMLDILSAITLLVWFFAGLLWLGLLIT